MTTPFDRALEQAADAYDEEMSKTVEDWSDIKSFIAGGNWARAFTQGEANESLCNSIRIEQANEIERLEAENKLLIDAINNDGPNPNETRLSKELAELKDFANRETQRKIAAWAERDELREDLKQLDRASDAQSRQWAALQKESAILRTHAEALAHLLKALVTEYDEGRPRREWMELIEQARVELERLTKGTTDER